MEEQDYSQQVAIIIPALNEADVIGSTVRACRVFPNADLVIVIDDGSQDDTQEVARAAGAVVVRHPVNRGKHSALETGIKVAQMRDPEQGRGRMLLFLDADLGESALELIPLITAVKDGLGMAIADSPGEATSGGRGFVTRMAARSIYRATGKKFQQPLSGQRCLSPEAAAQVLPVAYGWGVEVGMTIKLLKAGFTVEEIPCQVQHYNDEFPGWRHRLAQYRDVVWAMWRYSRKITPNTEN
ncbi:hypothetical protein BSR29_07315 [Boudabousia liubingyangii]|uniref:Glucosyl-3-phosphoglycerate synthase n=1 Tax=Boudabousia liubingyangii TaxID=1921764 RepID=A0A1Q5PKB9_9ACTO|nr:glycosyltransferase family 2 protein [Boudabousia liubingyangii]OKL46621.1 hypothetical protein BSR29_07315 [Boudabousia liubingyangii]OKL46790.1 hypothetical protein BSR28_04950 [Boudabousia liubingyangii]